MTAKVTVRNGALADFRRFAVQRFENAALIASDKMAKTMLDDLRAKMASAGLGRLGNAIGYGSDLKKSGRVHRRGASGFSASGWVYARSPDERTQGTLDSYLGTGSNEINPRNGRFLWIATDEIPKKAGRYRMTPALYRSTGLEQKIGPLVFIKSINGNPLLVAKNISVSAAGSPRKAKRLGKRGQLLKGQRAKEFVVAFVGIPRTSRVRRVDPRAIAREIQGRGAEFIRAALGNV